MQDVVTGETHCLCVSPVTVLWTILEPTKLMPMTYHPCRQFLAPHKLHPDRTLFSPPSLQLNKESSSWFYFLPSFTNYFCIKKSLVTTFILNFNKSADG